MKYILLIFTLVTSSSSFSQNDDLELIQEYLIDDAFANSREINIQERKLEKGLSSFMADRITRKSKPFRVNIENIKKTLAREQYNSEPKINLAVNFFGDSTPSYILINKIKTTHNRTMLRGLIEGHPDSNVKLVEYNGLLTGRISFASRKKVILLQSIDEGVSAMYEIDVSDLEYD